MIIEDQIRDGKLQYDINRKAAKNQLYHQAKLIRKNILLVKKYCHLINSKWYTKQNLLILHKEKPLKTNKNN